MLYQEYENVTLQAQDNGEEIDLAWALSLLKQYGMDTPDKADLDPREVRWLAGREAREEWEQLKADGYPPLADWTDEMPYISWSS